ncbi:Uncharacterised protein [Serratia proteamaculans]|uniref:hypothetical protein n=1 Tax=Serratia proteamaculans TaxID=28151 RepID=UPI00218441F1|nr:hypothetical protein [Serratia proteamaculans]CAI2500324.1 Uncharacterised protein [Serratia proteamaculans]
MKKINKYIMLLILSLATSVIFICVLWESKDQFSCQSNIIIKNRGSVFYGIINFNVSSDNGTVNINGFIKNETAPDYIINRTILFSSSIHGGISVWKSTNVSIGNTDTTPTQLLIGIIPQVYLESLTISDVSFQKLDNKSYLFLREFVPYAYCKVS